MTNQPKKSPSVPRMAPKMGAIVRIRHSGRDYPGVVTDVEEGGAVRVHAFAHGHSVLGPYTYSYDPSDTPAEKTWAYLEAPWGPGNDTASASSTSTTASGSAGDESGHD